MTFHALNRTEKGITLIELIVAVAILSTAVAGPMTLAASSLRATADARNQLIATHLAEEGVEVIHNIRDNVSADDITPGTSVPPWTRWAKTIMTQCGVGEGCVINVTDHSVGVWGPNTLLACPGGVCSSVSAVYFNPATGLYRQSLTPLGSPWAPSPFSRTVLVTPVNDDPTDPVREVQVTATVTFLGYGNHIRTVSVTGVLYNWFPPLN